MNRKKCIFLISLTAALALLTNPVSAHHSTAEFDMAASTSVKGTVTKFEWTNPHAYIYIQVKDDNGNTAEWSGELGSPGMLARVNWKRDTVKPGDEITIQGNPTKDGRKVLRLAKITFANGQELSAVVR